MSGANIERHLDRPLVHFGSPVGVRFYDKGEDTENGDAKETD